MSHHDTIVALSSGSLPSGVAVIRLSGPSVRDLLVRFCTRVPDPRHLTLLPIGTGFQRLDRGLVAFFPAPASFTGEDCAELQVHGSPAGVRGILRALAAEPGVRLAEAGEFTRRAFENGKLDLVSVEGLGDLLSAETENQRRQALARYEGGLTAEVDGWRETILDLRAEIEAQLDFSDEGDVGALAPDFVARIAELDVSLRSSIARIESGRIVREGLRVALAGPPNAGKSSLLNALAQSDIAIVTPEAGTTRDVREVPLDLDGHLVILVDLAGLRDTENLAEAEGVRRAKLEMQRADLVLWLIAPDQSDPGPPDTTAPIWRIAGKIDLAASQAPHDLALSARTGQGLDHLKQRLVDHANGAAGYSEPVLLSRERDRAALTQAAEAMLGAQAEIEHPEICAEHLREASYALERLIGRLGAEQVLDRLFLQFCIGK